MRDFVEGKAESRTYPFFEVREGEVQDVTCTRVGEETLERAGQKYDTLILDQLHEVLADGLRRLPGVADDERRLEGQAQIPDHLGAAQDSLDPCRPFDLGEDAIGSRLDPDEEPDGACVTAARSEAGTELGGVQGP